MRGRLAPVLIAVVFVASMLAGCIGGGGGDAKAGNGGGGGGGADEPAPTADTGAIEGIVTDIALSTFFVNALVAITIDGTKIVKNVTTDDIGQYYAGGLAPGEYKVFATYVDHKPQGKTVLVVAGEASVVNFILTPLPRVEPRMDPALELKFWIECGWGGPLINGDGAVSCGSQSPEQETSERFHISRGLSTMIIEATWRGVCTACLDGKPWLNFQLFKPGGQKVEDWKAPPEKTVMRFDHNLTEEVQNFLYGDDGNWTLKILPSAGNESNFYNQNGGLVSQLKIDVYVTLAYDNFYVPPEYTGFPDT